MLSAITPIESKGGEGTHGGGPRIMLSFDSQHIERLKKHDLRPQGNQKNIFTMKNENVIQVEPTIHETQKMR